MTKPAKLYWDSCAWLGLLNGEADKKRELEIIYNNARQGHYELWTSALAIVECRSLTGELKAQRPWDHANNVIIEGLFKQPFVKVITLDPRIAERSRELYRTHELIGKFQDAVHLASALQWNVSVMHTYDHDDLISLNGQLSCRNGERLVICYPNETTDGPLFARGA